jgi:8-oxo-dGTP pyrophosphatase MutT (NUDIX family)
MAEGKDLPRYQWARVGVKGLIFREGRVLLLHRRDDLDLLPGLWDLPGGGVEEGESPEEALVREVREETGYSVRVGRPVHLWITHSKLRSGEMVTGIIASFECTTRSSRDPQVDHDEHTEFRWVERDAVRRILLPPGQRMAIRMGFANRFTLPFPR